MERCVLTVSTDPLGFDDNVQPLAANRVKISPRRSVTVVRDIREACATIIPGEDVSWDLETGGLDPWRAPIAVISLYGSVSQTPIVLHLRGAMPDDVRALMSTKRLWIGHNVTNFDRLFLEARGIDTFAMGDHYDTLVGEGVAKTSGRHDVRVNLQATIQRRIGRKIAKNADHNSWMNPDLDEDQLAYCVDDVMALHRVRQEQIEKVESEGRGRAMVTEQELTNVICAMTLNGMPLDPVALAAWHKESREAMAEAGARLREVIGRPFVEDVEGLTAKEKRAADPFNVGSPMQLKKFIADRFGIELKSTEKGVLEEIAEVENDLGQFVRDVLTWRPGKKRTSMYDADWVHKYVQRDGRIHPRIWQVGTETGRTSATDPNMQQWPRNGRKVLGGEPGMLVVAADYDAIEVMIAAAIARDEQLLLDCTKTDDHDGDPHMALAAFMTGIDPSVMKKEERRLAKAANFTLLFGGGLNRFHQQCRLGDRSISEGTTSDYFNRYLRRYPGVDQMRMKARRAANAGVVSLDFPSGLRRVVAGPECRPTILINNAVQGTAAAGAKYAMLELWRRGLVRGRLSLMVHDELVSVVPEREAEEYANELSESMVVGMNRAIAGVPTRAPAKISTHWS